MRLRSTITLDDVREECILRNVDPEPVRLLVLDEAPALQRGHIAYSDGSREFAMWRRTPPVYLNLTKYTSWIAVDTPELREALGWWRAVNNADVRPIAEQFLH